MTTNDTRPAAVAGLFYSDDPARLASDVDAMLSSARSELGRAPKALVVPHAGFVYSGPVAASAYATLGRGEGIERVVLVGPSHRVALRGVAAPAARKLETPLGALEVDTDALDRAGVPRDAAAHAREHSLEVQLPFLQRVFGSRVRVCPIVCGPPEPPKAGRGENTRATSEDVARVLRELWGGPETLVLVSTDLSHYLPYAVGRRADDRTAEKILALDTGIDGEEACGYVGLRGFLLVAREKGLVGRLLDLRSSGDTAGSNDAGREVVGYGAFAFVAGSAEGGTAQTRGAAS